MKYYNRFVIHFYLKDAALGINGTSASSQVEKMIDFLALLQDSKYMSSSNNASDIAKSISVSLIFMITRRIYFFT